MDRERRKELTEQFKQIKTYLGIYQLRNTVNGKIYLASYPNLKNREVNLRNELDMGRHYNKALQKDWTEMGGDAFVYEVLEQKESNDITDKRWVLKQMEEEWMEKVQPYGDKGYHKPKGNA